MALTAFIRRDDFIPITRKKQLQQGFASPAPIRSIQEYRVGKQKMKTWTLGRDKDSDLVIDGATVSRKHAELTITRDGKYYLIDCMSTSGTFVAGKKQWEQISQSFVDITDTLLLGRQQMSMSEIVNSIETGNSIDVVNAKEVEEDNLPSGKVRRDPETGEPVKV